MKAKSGVIFTGLLFMLALMVLTTCKKDNNDPNNNPSDTLQANVKLIDKNISHLVSDSIQLSQGIYKFDFTGTPPVIAVGDVIVGAEGRGFLRKVTAVSSQGNMVTFLTEEADMGDLFNNAKFSFQTGIPSSKTDKSKGAGAQNLKINYLAPGVKLSPEGFDYDFSNTVIYQGGGVTFKITNGTAHFDPNFVGEVEYFLGIPIKISCYTEKADLTVSCNLNLKAAGSAEIFNFKYVIVDYDKPIIVIVCGIPVVIVAHTQLIATLNANVDATIDMTAGVTENYKLTLGAIWENGDWTGMYELTNSESFLPLAWTGNVHLGEKLTITPEVDFTFYGIVGPYFEPEMWEKFGLGVALPSLDWDAKLSVGLDAKVGVVVKIFGKTIKPCDLPPYSTSVDLWKAPDTIKIFSGNNQPGTPGQLLPNPIKVIVKDNLGNPRALVPVHFQVTQGGGSVAQESVFTSPGGFTETSWTLGTQPGTQVVYAAIKNSAGQIIQAQNFNATTSEAYSIEVLSGDNQTGTLGEPLPEPIEVIVKDISGEPFSGAKVNFEANNDGSVSALQMTTDADGVASVTWTLGGTDNTQTVDVTAFKSDQTTHLQGSPLTFSAAMATLCESGDYLSWWDTLYDDSKRAYNYVLGNGLVTTTPNEGGFVTLCETTQMDLTALGLSQLNGLEFFQNLASLNCNSNLLRSIDVSGCINLKELDLSQNFSLTSIAVSDCPNLSQLNCESDSLTSLDVSTCTNLNNLECGSNPSMISLDVSGCINLSLLHCVSNSLTTLDVSGLINLTSLDCSYNSLTSLNVSGCLNLYGLNCERNSLTGLDVSGCTNLLAIHCPENSLTSLSVSGCTTLASIDCSYNSLTSLDISGLTNLADLTCPNNQLTSLDFEDCTNLASLNCSFNSLTTLNITGLINLIYLGCAHNGLTNLDVSGYTNLVGIDCTWNGLTSLDVSGCTNLTNIGCLYNGLTSLNISGCVNLESLSCQNNYFNYNTLVTIITWHVPVLHWSCCLASATNGPDPDNPYIGSDCYLLNQLYDQIYGGK
jgi:hypothetical protein